MLRFSFNIDEFDKALFIIEVILFLILLAAIFMKESIGKFVQSIILFLYILLHYIKFTNYFILVSIYIVFYFHLNIHGFFKSYFNIKFIALLSFLYSTFIYHYLFQGIEFQEEIISDVSRFSMALLFFWIIGKKILAKQVLLFNKIISKHDNNINEKEFKSRQLKEELIILSKIADEQAKNMVNIVMEERNNIGSILEDDLKLDLQNVKDGLLECEGIISNKKSFKLLLSTINSSLVYIKESRFNFDRGDISNIHFKKALNILIKKMSLIGGYKFSYNYKLRDLYITEADRFLLYNIIRELLHNTNKHSKADKVKLELSIDRNSRIIISVEDNGVGFNSRFNMNDSFEPTNLGLPAIKKRVEEMGGSIVVNNSSLGGAFISINYKLR